MKGLLGVFLFSLSLNSFAFKPREIVTITNESPRRFNQPWLRLAKKEKDSLRILISLIERSPTGKLIVAKARKRARSYDKNLVDVIQAGDGSLTDTTLIRRFFADSPHKVSYEAKSKVYLDRRLKVVEAILDLSHELTHFAFRAPFNPYKNFHAKKFIRSTVEGAGGEVEAYMNECRVLQDLFPASVQSKFNCKRIWDPTVDRPSREKTVQEFYKVGESYPRFVRSLRSMGIEKDSFPLLSEGEALFYSSAYGSPYPVAALEEFQTVLVKVCQNDHKRLALLENKVGRSPASTSNESDILAYRSMKQRFNEVCHYFKPYL